MSTFNSGFRAGFRTDSLVRGLSIGAAGAVIAIAGSLASAGGYASTAASGFRDIDGDRSQVITVTNDEGDRIQVKIVNNDAPVVTVNGKKIDSDRVEYNRATGKITIKDKGGNTIHVVTTQFPSVPRLGSGIGGRVGGLTLTQTPGIGIAPSAVQASEKPKVMIGIYRSDLSPELAAHLGLEDKPAFVIEKIVPGLGADRAGLQTYDIVTGVDGKPASELGEVLRDKQPGSELSLDIIRRGESKKVTIKLEAYDSQKLATVESEMVDIDPDNPLARFPSLGNGQASPLNNIRTFAWSSRGADEQARETLEEAMSKLEGQLPQADFQAAREAIEKAVRELEESRSELLSIAPRMQGDMLIIPPTPSAPGSARASQSEELNTRLDMLEQRFDSLESRWDSLADRFERLFERLERSSDSDD